MKRYQYLHRQVANVIKKIEIVTEDCVLICVEDFQSIDELIILRSLESLFVLFPLPFFPHLFVFFERIARANMDFMPVYKIEL